ncbi:heme biosynthesis HemY N-terminal domain-containing protein [Magnetospirillum sp. 15-1]|uniref:heme biosynthesis HemY N-terminal domain-containing protein n=1 Tax=Magnetospirillum sp. 15-1 TaxID=1979370 RepID=UPI001F5B3FB4|nr:heme biosynthesis HemY N-terminal domain-containing protein [Magnetospirillum sp. 15-1]
MRRLLAFLILTGVVVAGAVWLADRPGEVTIHWLGWRVDTTVPVLLAALVLLLVALSVLNRLVRTVFGAPPAAGSNRAASAASPSAQGLYRPAPTGWRRRLRATPCAPASWPARPTGCCGTRRSPGC